MGLLKFAIYVAAKLVHSRKTQATEDDSNSPSTSHKAKIARVIRKYEQRRQRRLNRDANMYALYGFPLYWDSELYGCYNPDPVAVWTSLFIEEHENVATNVQVATTNIPPSYQAACQSNTTSEGCVDLEVPPPYTRSVSM